MKKIFALIMVLGLLFGFASTASAETGSEQIETIKIGVTSKQGSFTPFDDIGTKSWDLLGLVYDNLYQIDQDRHMIPCLATSYEVSEDYMTYTFHLRDDVLWHDGEKFTSADVEYSYYIPANLINSINFTNPAKNIQSIECPDDYTVVFHLKEARSEEIIENLFGYMPIVAKHVYETMTADEINAGGKIVGTGPYKIADYTPDDYYKLEANDGYFGGTPAAKQIILVTIEDKTAALTALQSGQVDTITNSIPAELVDQFQSSANLKLLQGQGFASCLMFMNESRYPISEDDFRKAIVKALDVEDIANTVTLGRCTIGSPGFVMPGYYLYNEACPKYAQDVNMANQLLDGLGFLDSNGDGVREDANGADLAFELLVYSSTADRIRVAEIIAEQLRAVGISLKVTALESGTLDSLVAPNWDGIEPGDYDFSMWGWGDKFMSTPSRYVEQFHSDPAIAPSNLTRINEPEMDKICERILYSLDLEERNEAVDEMQLFLVEHNTLVTLYYANLNFAYNPAVYDQWTLTFGKSIVNKLSLVNWSDVEIAQETAQPEPTAVPEATAAPAADDSGAKEPAAQGSPILWIVLGVVGVIIIASVIGKAIKKKKQ